MRKMKYSQDEVAGKEKAIEYVIYCRKSSDESSEKQVASIGRQIAECTRYAKREGINIKKKPKNFSFETEEELKKENNDKDLNDKALYKETRGLFIVKEQHSAKNPGKRKKWKKLVKMIQKREIGGLLSYSPDRQSRNMLEGGEIIDFVDNNLTELRYTNFHFEPTASGKMMLGIWFVFSKQYSDKLSEDVTAGNARKLEKGESLGAIKHGYTQNENMKWIPHPINFEIVQWGFKTKITKGWSDEKIANAMNKKGFKRIMKKSGQEVLMSKQKLNTMWTEPFYCGMWLRADDEINLNEEKSYSPIITFEEHEILCERFKEFNMRGKREINKKDEIESIRVTGNDFVQDQGGNLYMVTLPNKKTRHFKKLKDIKKENPKAILGDVVTPRQIIYHCGKTKSSISFEVIENAILKKLNQLQITEEQYTAYLLYAKDRIKEDIKNIQIERKKIQIRINSSSSKRRRYIEDNIHATGKRNKEEEKIYRGQIDGFDKSLEYYKSEVRKLDLDEERTIFDISTMTEFIHNAVKYYSKASYVQKRSIIQTLFLNTIINNKKSITVTVKPELESLFVLSGRRNRT